MKKVMLLVWIFGCGLFFFPKVHLAQATEAKKNWESIELIEGVPQRKFQKISPIWVMAGKMPTAIKKAKKEAFKIGADAIVELKFGSQDTSGAAASGGIFVGGSQPYPVVQGWAVKWQ